MTPLEGYFRSVVCMKSSLYTYHMNLILTEYVNRDVGILEKHTEKLVYQPSFIYSSINSLHKTPPRVLSRDLIFSLPNYIRLFPSFKKWTVRHIPKDERQKYVRFLFSLSRELYSTSLQMPELQKIHGEYFASYGNWCSNIDIWGREVGGQKFPQFRSSEKKLKGTPM